MRASRRKSECFTIPTKRGNQPEAMSRKGYWVVKQKTAADRFRRALKRIAEWCRQYRHEPVREQWAALKRKLLGHFGYFAVIGSLRALRNFRHQVCGVWRKWLSRSSQRARMSWETMNRLLQRYPLPQPHMPPPLGSSEAVDRRAGCDKFARPYPTEPRGSNPLRRPDRGCCCNPSVADGWFTRAGAILLGRDSGVGAA